jgi:hypothetical protein
MKINRAPLVIFLTCIAFAISMPSSAETVVVRAGRMLDVEQGKYLTDRAIRIEDGRIASITPWTPGSRGGSRLIDWSAYTVLPGLIDLHTHLVGDISSADVAAPLSSSAARDALMGAAHARATLNAGFTTVRDVGTYRAFVDVALPRAAGGIGQAVVWLVGVTHGPRDTSARRLSLKLDDCRLVPRVQRAPVGGWSKADKRGQGWNAGERDGFLGFEACGTRRFAHVVVPVIG